MTAENDEAIVCAVQDGQKEAFGRLVDRHKERVYAMLMRLTGDPQAAEELAHEAFVRSYRNLKNFRGKSRFSTWLTQIAINLARDHIRERQRSKAVSLEAILERDPDTLQFAERRSHYDPLAEVSARDMIEKFEIALRELPQNYREVFVLHHIQDVSYEDIAAATGDSVGSLKVRAHRARKLLKDKLFPEETSVTPEDILRQKR